MIINIVFTVTVSSIVYINKHKNTYNIKVIFLKINSRLILEYLLINIKIPCLCSL